RSYEPRGGLAEAMTTSARPSTPSFPVATWAQARRPGLRRETGPACSPYHPGTCRVVRLSIHPPSLSAFPVRRDGRQVQFRRTRRLWVPWCGSPLLCIDRSRSLEPMHDSRHPPSCSTPEWTIGVKGLSPYVFHACTGVPSAYLIYRRRRYSGSLGSKEG